MRNLQIKTDLFYDIMLSQYNFEENFKRIDNSMNFVYTDFGNLSGDFDENDFFIINYKKTKKRDINKLKVYLSDDDCIRDVLLSDLIYEFLGGDNLDNLETLLNEYNIIYDCTYEILYTRGYSQGDYAEIYVNKKEFKDVIGVEFNSDDYQSIFNHYFWDIPISGELNIIFDYTTLKGINHTFNLLKLYDDSYISDFLISEYDLTFDYDYLFKSINAKLIDYELNEDEIMQIKKGLDNIDYDDIRQV